MTHFGIFVLVVLTTSSLLQSHGAQSFNCPSCQAYTLEDCDANIEPETCSKEDPVCVLYRTDEEGQTEFERFCASRDGYNYGKDRCDNNPQYNCATAMCDKSGCKAEL